MHGSVGPMAGLALVEDAPAVGLAVYAHPDCGVVAAGGTMAAWVDAGADVHLLVCARGDKGSTERDLDTEAFAELRADELTESARLLGLASVETLPFGDGELNAGPDLTRAVVSVIRRIRPDTVLLPDPTAVFFGDSYVNHPDHRATGWAALDAVGPSSSNPNYHRDLGPAHQVKVAYLSGTLEPDVVVDIGAVVERKVEAITAQRSQFGEGARWIDDAVRARAAEAGAEAGLGAAEEFRRLVFG